MSLLRASGHIIGDWEVFSMTSRTGACAPSIRVSPSWLRQHPTLPENLWRRALSPGQDLGAEPKHHKTRSPRLAKLGQCLFRHPLVRPDTGQVIVCCTTRLFDPLPHHLCSRQIRIAGVLSHFEQCKRTSASPRRSSDQSSRSTSALLPTDSRTRKTSSTSIPAAAMFSCIARKLGSICRTCSNSFNARSYRFCVA